MALMRPTPGHRGLHHYVWTWRQTAEVLGLWLVLSGLTLLAIPWITQGWLGVLQAAWPALGLGPASSLGTTAVSHWGLVWPHFHIDMPTPLPARWQWWCYVLGALFSLVASSRMSRNQLPWIYLVRVVATLCLLSALAFEFLTIRMVSNPGHLVIDTLALATFLIGFLPSLHALILYIFPLPIRIKVLATLCAMGFVVVSAPLQAGSLALLAQHGSALAIMPLYMLATALPQLLVQLAIYGYFMSLAPPFPTEPPPPDDAADSLYGGQPKA